MTAKIIHVDFRARKPMSRYEEAGMTEEEFQAVIDAVTVPAPEVTDPVLPPGFLMPETHTYGSKYEETKDLRVQDIAKVVKAYAKDTYPLLKFSVRTHHKTIRVRVMDPGPVAVFRLDGAMLSEVMKEIMKDIEDFMNTFNYDKSDIMSDYFDARFYVDVAVDRAITEAVRRT